MFTQSSIIHHQKMKAKKKKLSRCNGWIIIWSGWFPMCRGQAWIPFLLTSLYFRGSSPCWIFFRRPAQGIKRGTSIWTQWIYYLCVPACPFHVKPVDAGPLTRCNAEVLPVLLGDIALQTHAVQGPLVSMGQRHKDVLSFNPMLPCTPPQPLMLPSSRGLHDGCQERLRVEEAG